MTIEGTKWGPAPAPLTFKVKVTDNSLPDECDASVRIAYGIPKGVDLLYTDEEGCNITVSNLFLLADETQSVTLSCSTLRLAAGTGNGGTDLACVAPRNGFRAAAPSRAASTDKSQAKQLTSRQHVLAGAAVKASPLLRQSPGAESEPAPVPSPHGTYAPPRDSQFRWGFSR